MTLHGEASPESSYVFALVDKKGGEAVAEVVKAESLTVFEPDANLNRGWTNFSRGVDCDLQVIPAELRYRSMRSLEHRMLM
jgi:hypothetical protein